MKAKESLQQYINYDFDDSHGFFMDELTSYMKSIVRKDPIETMNIDFSQQFANIITSLFDSCDALIIRYEKLKLYGEVGGKKFFIKNGYIEH